MTSNTLKTALPAVLAIGLALFACADTGPQNAQGPGLDQAPVQAAPARQPAAAAPAGRMTEDERNTIDVVRKTKNSVVFITNLQYVRDFFYSSDQPVPRGSGSGFVWDDQGHIVTNFHVVEEGEKFMVSLPDQRQVEAALVGYERNKDIAVLKLGERVSGLTPVATGTSRDLQVGQKVVAVGNPFGFDHTVTQGIVSALGRNMPGAGGVTIRDMVQTDASINPGNSGGPLLDNAGRLIGVNTAIYSPSGASAGIGFAVPVDTVFRIVPELVTHGRVVRPVLGVGLADDQVNAYVLRQLGVEGALVYQVFRGTGAAEAGLQPTVRDRSGRMALGDVIQEIDEKPVRSRSDLLGRLGGYKPGDTVTLTLWNEGKTRKARVRLAAPE
jgi:S1-C subfamily serine protease